MNFPELQKCLVCKIIGIFIYDGISFIRGWKWWWTKCEISEVWELIKLMTGLPGLFSLCILGVI